tara:strand:- start:73 stop:1044 length:972 start_codon:yes stop_codon:yes gene_type:complete
LKNLKNLHRKLLFIITSFLIIFSFIEVILRSGFIESYSTIWISPESYKVRHSIEDDLYKRANKNERDGYFFFNDEIPQKQKITKKRIITLGDSFVFGEGLIYRNSWPHKLDKLIKNKGYSVETLAWGVGGWSSKDQFAFFKEYGLEYNPDFLIIGFVDNDPEELMEFPKCKSKAFQISDFWKKSKKLYIVLFIDQHLARLNYMVNCENHIRRLYSKKNLDLYEKLILDFKFFLDKNKIPFVFILTPSNYDKHFKFVNSKIIPILSKHNIKYINTYPEVVRKTSHIPYRLLWANPGDRHPGEQLTEIFAKEAFQFLEHDQLFSF